MACKPHCNNDECEYNVDEPTEEMKADHKKFSAQAGRNLNKALNEKCLMLPIYVASDIAAVCLSAVLMAIHEDDRFAATKAMLAVTLRKIREGMTGYGIDMPECEIIFCTKEELTDEKGVILH